jgi:hypothetical protein
MTATPLTIDELFTPAPSGIGGNPNVAPASGSWMAILLQIAATVGLPTTAWQAGQPERSILSIDSVALAQLDGIVSLIAQGGFLDFAASGTVTVPGNTPSQPSITIPVTPDPSNAAENPTGEPGWLDALGQSVYNVTRLQASFASGALAIVNTLVASAGPYDVGTYHVANTRTQATYKNIAALTIPSSRIAGTGGVITSVIASTTTTVTTQSAHGVSPNDTVFINGVGGITGINGAFAQVASVPSPTTLTLSIVTGGAFTSGGTLYLCTVQDFEADVIGIGSNAAPGDVSSQVTQINGIATSNLGAWSAANYESNTDYAQRCRDKLAAASPNGAAAAYEYFAKTAFVLLAAQTPPIVLTNGPIASAKAFGSPQTGEVLTVVASTSPASVVLGEAITPGCVALDVIAATNATPIVVTSAAPHGLLTGNVATIEGVIGNAATNGTWTITRISPATFSLDGSAGSGAYTGGGQIDGGDLGQVNQIIQNNCVDDNAIALTVSALALPITISAVVNVPAAFKTVYRNAVAAAFVQFFKTLAIGGGDAGVVDYSAIEGVFFEVGVQVVGATSYVRSVQNLLVNGGTGNVPFPSPQYEAILGTLNASIVGS